MPLLLTLLLLASNNAVSSDSITTYTDTKPSEEKPAETASNAATHTNITQNKYKVAGLETHAQIDPHLEAFISNDFERFKALFHEEIEVYSFPDKLLYKGRAEFDKNYEKLVSKINKSAFITKRIVEGSFVVDMEIIKLQLPSGDEHIIEGLVIFQIKDNLIYRMMFLEEK
jgi:hypothetical protein